MATPNLVKVDPYLSLDDGRDGFLYRVSVKEGERTELYTVTISRTEAVVGGFGDDGPPPGWVADGFRRRASGRLENGRSIVEQLDEWRAQEYPFVLRADPS